MNAMGKDVRVGNLDDSLYHLLKRAAQVAADIFSEQAGRSSLTQRQYALLHALSRHNGASQMQLVKLTGIDRSTLADMARRLEERGLIRRRSSRRDKRAKSLHLTQKGRAALQDVEPLMAEVDRRMLGVLSAEQQTQFIDALKRIAHATSMIGQEIAEDAEHSGRMQEGMRRAGGRQGSVGTYGQEPERPVAGSVIGQ